MEHTHFTEPLFCQFVLPTWNISSISCLEKIGCSSSLVSRNSTVIVTLRARLLSSTQLWSWLKRFGTLLREWVEKMCALLNLVCMCVHNCVCLREFLFLCTAFRASLRTRACVRACVRAHVRARAVSSPAGQPVRGDRPCPGSPSHPSRPDHKKHY